MIRLFYYIIGSLIVAAVAAWLVAVPGTITIEFGGYRMQPGIGAAAGLLLAIIIAIILVWSILRRILNAPRAIARRAKARRREQGVDALSDGFIALQAGDAGRARQLARDARARLPENRAAQLLEARAALAQGDMPAARDEYRALIGDQKTAMAALAGLYDQARAQGREQAALTFARKAAGIDPDNGWAATAVFDDLTKRRAWTEALTMVAARPAPNREAKAQKRRRQAVLDTAIAAETEPTDPNSALDHAMSALKLVPDFVPAALIAARIYAHRGEARKAQSLLRRVWRATGHPDVATLYANVVPGSSAIDRLKRTRELIDTPPPDRSAAIVLARAAIDAYEWPAARSALAGFAASSPSQLVCTLMAEIEEGQNGDQGKAREWLSRAVRAPRDPVWTADGITAEEWQPVSPLTGKLDAFEWKVPVSDAPRLLTEGPPQGPTQSGEPLALPQQ